MTKNEDEGDENQENISATGSQALHTSGFRNIKVPSELNQVGNMAENYNFFKRG